MTAPKLPTEEELSLIEAALNEAGPVRRLSPTMAIAMSADRLIAGCREALRLQVERRKLAEAWMRADEHAVRGWVKFHAQRLGMTLDALAAECGKETER